MVTRRMNWRPAVAVVCCWLGLSAGPSGAVPQQPVKDDGVSALLRRVEQIMTGGKPEAYYELLGTFADRTSARTAAQLLVSSTMTRTVLRERDRVPLDGALPGDGYRLMVEAFIEYTDRARVSTWRFDVRRVGDGDTADAWVIAGQQQISVVDGLYRLSLNRSRQYRVQNLVLRSEDLEVRMPSGRMFISDTQEGPTAAVLLPGNDARFTFKPTPATEREQVKLFAGSEDITDGFSAIFLRLNALDFGELFPPSAVQLEAVDEGSLRRAESVFREDVNKSFSLDMGDLSRDAWSLSPNSGDLLAEIRTRQFQTITYAKSSGDPEDITVFDRRRRKNISVYASRDHVGDRGRFFDEDASAAYDITDYQVETRFEPERNQIDGRTRLRLKVRDSALSSLTLKLADSLAVRSVFSPELGRLLFLRVRNQHSLVVNLPAVATPGAELTLDVEYGGPLQPSMIEREAVSVGQSQPQDPFTADLLGIPGEASWLFTTRTYWYPQSSVSDYAPAVLRLTVPAGYGVLASGELMAGFPRTVAPPDGRRSPDRQYAFSAPQPLRYLSCLITKFVRAGARSVNLDSALTTVGPDGSRESVRPVRPGVYYDALSLSVDTNPRLRTRGVRMLDTAEDIVRFYVSLVGDSPYPGLSVGLVEKELPGGHSPAYLSVVNPPMPQVNFSWGNDPSAFQNYPEFFVAHEIAHQWWGQAVGWRSYHEQWISEGFAQYFAALYARHSRGEQAFDDVMRRMAKFAREQSSQGPISLGYRLGHVRNDMRVFRSLVYNKAAVVLHNLRLLLGDEVFWRGLRRFYFDWRFKKASTLDVQRAFEAESGQDLSVYFDGWIHTSGIPVVRFSWARDAGATDAAALVRFEQVGAVFDLPVVVTLHFADRTTRDVIVPVRSRTTEVRVPFTGDLRDITVKEDGTTLVSVYRQ